MMFNQPFNLCRAIIWCSALAVTLLTSACTSGPHLLARDPYEFVNRQVFSFNEGLDANIVKPAAKAYDTVTPVPLQNAVENFTNNIKDVWSLTNLILQGQGAGALYEFMRVGVNTTFGLAGLVDVATDMRLDRQNEDLGQTLAVWGVPNGPYLVLPVFGPSNVRDAAALPFDQYVMPASLLREPRDANAMRVVQVLNTRAKYLTASDLLDDAALDKYAFVRDAYLQHRRNMIYNGEPPDDEVVDELGFDTTAPSVWTAQVRVPRVLTKHMTEPLLQDALSKFWASDMAFGDSATSAVPDGWASGVELPTLPSNVPWQAVLSTP